MATILPVHATKMRKVISGLPYLIGGLLRTCLSGSDYVPGLILRKSLEGVSPTLERLPNKTMISMPMDLGVSAHSNGVFTDLVQKQQGPSPCFTVQIRYAVPQSETTSAP